MPKMTPETTNRRYSDAPDRISILAVTTTQQSGEIERALSHTRWRIHTVHSIGEAVRMLHSLPFAVILCEDRLPDGTWLDLARETAPMNPRPQTVVLSTCPNSALWDEVLNCGGYYLLGLPLEPREMYTLLPMAWRLYQASRATEVTSTRHLAASR